MAEKNRKDMKVIGITGGVGSGKSRVLAYLKEHCGFMVYEADEIARKLQEPGQVCFEKIVEHFGTHILREDGWIDRQGLAQIVFAETGKQELAALNQIVHPEVKQYVIRHIEEERQSGTKCFVLEAALLLEEHYDKMCDEVWYIHAEKAVRIERLMESRGYSNEKAEAMMRAQLLEEVFYTHCGRVIENGGTFEETCVQIEKILEEWRNER